MSAKFVEGLEARRLLADTLAATVNGAKVHQTIDALGAALNSGWQPKDYRSSAFMNQVVGDLGISAVRSALDPGWELANDNADPNSINWTKFDDSAIGTTMEFFKQAKARGVNTFLLTVWTPSGWMKTNKAAAYGGQLRPDQREEYAEYIAAALIRAKTKWGVDITQVSIMNEPWFTEPYPSDVWTPNQWKETIKVVAARFQKEGLTAQIVGPEDVSSLYRTQKYVSAVAADPVANAEMPIIGSHYLNDQDMQTLAASAVGWNKKIWYTEVGSGAPDAAGAVALARGIDSAFTRGQANAWINWQLSNTNATESLMTNGVPNAKYYALKHFAHFIRPGAQRIDVAYTGDTVRVSAFKHPTSGALTIELSNNRTTPVDVNLSLAGLSIPASFQQYRTSANENCVQLANVAGAANMVVTLPAGSIVTLYAGPDLVTPQLATGSPLVTPTQWSDAWSSNALRSAAMTGSLDTVKSLIANGADVNAAFGNGWTPLFTASASPQNKADMIVDALLNAGADPLHRDVDGATALHVAAMSEIPAYGTIPQISASRVKRLLAAGVPVNAQDNYGRTALIYAAMLPKIGGDFGRADTSVLQALLAAGADPTIKDLTGRTALDWAIAENAKQAIGVLSPPGTLEAHVYKDNNANGTQDAGDTPLSGVSVYIDLNSNGKADSEEPTATSNASGVATFGTQFIDDYTLRAATPDATFTPAVAAASVTVLSGKLAVANLPFVPPNAPPPPPPPPGTAQLSGYVVNDKNGDGTWGSGEVGVAGRTVFIDTNTNGTLDSGELSAVTASNGKYLFTNISAGTYTLREILPTGWTQTRPTAGTALVTTIKDGVIRSGLDFYTTGGTVVPPPPPPGTASISAYVINDTIRDGKWSSGEKGVSSRTVWLDLDNDNIKDANEPTAITGTNGGFTFANLAAGQYFIRQVLPAGWIQTYPSTNGALTITLTAGQAKSGSSLGTALA